jgi:hypothetical protein
MPMGGEGGNETFIVPIPASLAEPILAWRRAKTTKKKAEPDNIMIVTAFRDFISNPQKREFALSLLRINRMDMTVVFMEQYQQLRGAPSEKIDLYELLAVVETNGSVTFPLTPEQVDGPRAYERDTRVTKRMVRDIIRRKGFTIMIKLTQKQNGGGHANTVFIRYAPDKKGGGKLKAMIVEPHAIRGSGAMAIKRSVEDWLNGVVAVVLKKQGKTGIVDRLSQRLGASGFIVQVSEPITRGGGVAETRTDVRHVGPVSRDGRGVELLVARRV